MITFYNGGGDKVHVTNAVASLAPAIGSTVKIQGEDGSFKVTEVIFVYNGGCEAEVYVESLQ